jgi:putative transcriptional regulator
VVFARRDRRARKGETTLNAIAVERTAGVEAMLASYVAGTLSEPLNALFGAHLALSTRHHGYVRALETAAGRMLEETWPEATLPAVASRDAKLAAIFSGGGMPLRAPAARPQRSNSVLPAPLAAYLGRDLADVPWKRELPGIKAWHVAETEHGEATMYWIRGGQKLPTHSHEGSEITLVLAGAFSDVSGHYGRGDIAIADEAVDHRPIADESADCICFAVTDAPLRLTGPLGRWVQPFLKRT